MTGPMIATAIFLTLLVAALVAVLTVDHWSLDGWNPPRHRRGRRPDRPAIVIRYNTGGPLARCAWHGDLSEFPRRYTSDAMDDAVVHAERCWRK